MLLAKERGIAAETFTEMRERLQEVHGWDRKVASVAARYYLGVDNYETLCTHTRPAIVRSDYFTRPLLTEDQLREIVMWR